MSKTSDTTAFQGYWKITHMDVWAQTYVDLVVPGFIEFTLDDDLLMGSFQFGTVSGWLDCRLRVLDGVTCIEWSWQGQNDTDPGNGRGWAQLVEGELVGRIFIHAGDDSAFRATRRQRPAERPKPTVKGGPKATATRASSSPVPPRLPTRSRKPCRSSSSKSRTRINAGAKSRRRRELSSAAIRHANVPKRGSEQGLPSMVSSDDEDVLADDGDDEVDDDLAEEDA
jgi:hypothetical protein